MEPGDQSGPSGIPFAQRPRAERLAYLERWVEAARNAQRPVRPPEPRPRPK